MTSAFEPTEFAREFQAFLQGVNLRDVPGEVPDSALERIVAATSGVSAAFMRELVRRAVLLAADEATDEAASGGDVAVGDRHLLTALAALDAASAPLRRVLGAGTGA
jgi:hypothetical protein